MGGERERIVADQHGRGVEGSRYVDEPRSAPAPRWRGGMNQLCRGRDRFAVWIRPRGWRPDAARDRRTRLACEDVGNLRAARRVEQFKKRGLPEICLETVCSALLAACEAQRERLSVRRGEVPHPAEGEVIASRRLPLAASAARSSCASGRSGRTGAAVRIDDALAARSRGARGDQARSTCHASAVRVSLALIRWRARGRLERRTPGAGGPGLGRASRSLSAISLSLPQNKPVERHVTRVNSTTTAMKAARGTSRRPLYCEATGA